MFTSSRNRIARSGLACSGQVSGADGSPNSKGVAILFDRQADFKVLSQVSDDEGRFLGMDVLLEDEV